MKLINVEVSGLGDLGTWGPGTGDLGTGDLGPGDLIDRPLLY